MSARTGMTLRRLATTTPRLGVNIISPGRIASRLGHTPQAACNFSSSSIRKSWFKEPPKKSWWSEPPKKPSRAAQFIENLVIGAVCIGSIGYCLTLSAVTDRLKAEMKNLDIFGVEKLRDDLEKHIRTSEKPNEAIDHDDCLPSASKMGSASASGCGQPPSSNLSSPETHSSLLLAAAQAQDTETQEAERMRLTRARIPSPNSEDPEERLAAYWKDPKNKPELSEWWDSMSHEEHQECWWYVAMRFRYKFGVDWPDDYSNPFEESNEGA